MGQGDEDVAKIVESVANGDENVAMVRRAYCLEQHVKPSKR